MKVTVNPEAQASGDFGYADAGEYTLRVVKVDLQQKAGSPNPYLKWEFEFADPNVESVEKNKDGSGRIVGHIFENTTLKPEAQFALRNVCEALGLTWGDFDTDECVGKELQAKVKIKLYDDVHSNEVSKYIPATS